MLGAGAIIVRGADYSGTEGELPTPSAPARHAVSAFDSLAGRPVTFLPDLYYHLVLGMVGAGDWSGLNKAIAVEGLLVNPPRAAGQHFRPAMQPVNYFNWGRGKPAIAFHMDHFHPPAKSLPSVDVANLAKPGPIQFPDVPTLNQKAPGPNHIIDDPKNAVELQRP